MSQLRKTLILVCIFSIAMGFLESAVVIYLRELYYPFGFKFPLIVLPSNITLVEILREAATIIMLVSVGIISGKNAAQRFSFFLFSFAVWDIVYYIFLRIFTGWPDSLFTWDLLFLIPLPWVGPVITPCLLSMTMIILTITVIYFSEKNIPVSLRPREWVFLISGAVTVIVSFIEDYVHYSITNGFDFWKTGNEVSSAFFHYVPEKFNWGLFAAGELLNLIGIAIFIRREKGLIVHEKRKGF
jgi:hypothetical protein